LPNAEPWVGPVVINEVMFAPLNEGTNTLHEYIEIHNRSANLVALRDPQYGNRWMLSNAVEFVFPANATIPAGSSLLVVSFNPGVNPGARAAFEARYGTGHTLTGPFRGSLDNMSDSVELYAPGLPVTFPGPDFGRVPYILVEKVAYRDRFPWPSSGAQPGTSLQRLNPMAYANDPNNWVAVLPTAGSMNRSDSDADEMPDQWERVYGLNPNDARDADLDPDGDGKTNLEEYLSGTHPTDPNDVLRLMVSLDGLTVLLRFSAAAERAYQLQYRSEADQGAWTKLADIAAAPSTRKVEVSDTLPTVRAQRFYRLLSQDR
jgi:hypothetical protein